MIGLPARDEAASYYYRYIDRVSNNDVLQELETQLQQLPRFFRSISEEKSLYAYEPEKWSMRQVLNHINDSERVFLFRAFWFARGFSTPLPSFDQNVAVNAAAADEISWTKHIEDFVAVRQASLNFFRNLPQPAWLLTGIASDNSFTVRSLAYIIAGHAAHHTGILQERYL
ncbi:MAG TPA: DinB family protein [Candidatus Angelobacter sp.]|nr:DinB family protein [Candidatus Angelobacter sp.]